MGRKKVLILAVIAVVCAAAYFWSRAVYEEKYDAYYNARLAEYLSENYSAGTLQARVAINTNQTEYNHLGTDISFVHTCNGKEVSSGSVVPMRKQMTFETTITEYDDSKSDTGAGSVVVCPSLTSYKGRETMSITVRERGGTKYKQAYAKWEITVAVEPVINLPPAKYWDVVFS